MAHADDCTLTGHVALAAERLSDLLNGHDEVLLVDVLAVALADGVGHEVREFLVRRDELLLVHATGPRGLRERRIRTRPQRVVIRTGPYEVQGDLHCAPGADPLASFHRRRPMVALTEARISTLGAGTREDRFVGTVIVNRLRATSIALARPEEVRLPDFPVAAIDPSAKDLTGYVHISDARRADGT